MQRTEAILGFGAPTARKARLLIVAGWLLATLIFVVGSLTGIAEAFFDGVFLPVVFGTLLVLATFGCTEFALRQRRDRLAWVLIAAGIGFWTLGAVSRTVFFGGTDDRPVPAWIDPVFLVFYPAVFTGLCLVVSARLRRFKALPWLDGTTGWLAIFAIAFAFFYEPMLDSSSGDVLEALTLLAYPAGDIAIIGMLLVLLKINGIRLDGPWIYVASGLLLFAIADVLFAVLVPGPGAIAAPVWALWIIGTLLIVIGTWHDESDAREWTPGHTQLLIPLTFGLIAFVILIIGQRRELPAPAIVSSVAVLVSMVFRLFISARENLKLFDSRDLALHDDLTGLASRRAVDNRLQEIGEDIGSTTHPVIMVVAELDRFRELNAALGYRVGDVLLSAVATRLNRSVGDYGQLGRLSGTRFSLIVDQTNESPPAEDLARMIEGALVSPILVDGLRVHVDITIGIAIYPDHGKNGIELTRLAELAIRQARQRSLGYLVCTGDEGESAIHQLRLLEDLRAGLQNGQLEVFYQPKVGASDRQVRSVEALVRWNRSKSELLAPGQFLEVAESAGLMHEITNIVLEQALDQMAEWRDRGRLLKVAVNLAMPNLLDTGLPDDITRRLAARSLDPGDLTLEVTENIVMSDPERVLGNLNRLSDAGIRISLDDFGVGNTSLSYLQKLPLDEVKMDRSLVANLKQGPKAAALTTAAIKLTRNLGLDVVAEGVEDMELAAELEKLDCTDLQGYVFTRPLSAADFDRWLAGYSATAEAPA